MLTVDYYTESQLEQCRTHHWSNILGIARIGEKNTRVEANFPVALVQARALGVSPLVYEVWRAAEPLHNNAFGDVEYRTNGHFLFGRIAIQASVTLSHATENAYDQIFACLRKIGVPHLLRVWHYLPQINQQNDGLERYRQFNEARQKSFNKYGDLFRAHSPAALAPAACALGTGPNTALSIYFIASVSAPITIENPRQVPAYNYPAEYGDFRPLFSRATLLKCPLASVLFISGTSSIVGHSTVSAGNILGQTRETLVNIRSVVDTVQERIDNTHFVLEKLRFKIYLRHVRDHEIVARELAERLDLKFPAMYLQADICRADLSIEIEAFGALA